MIQPRAIAVILITLFLAGCGALSPRPDPSKYFTLSSLPASESAYTESRKAAEMISVGIGPLQFPGYLDRPEIVFRTAQNRLRVSENDRWAEPLDENFSRILAQNLSALLGTDRIVPYPWPGNGKPKYQVRIEVLAFETNGAREAQLTARWLVSDGFSRKPFDSKLSRLVRTAKETSVDSSVAALSETLADLSREIADAVRTADAGKSNEEK
jgi:uncharacterized lipoprotein YmbA